MNVFKPKSRYYQRYKQILSRSYASKEEFLREFEKLYDKKSKFKVFYLLVLTELEKAVSEGDIDSFKRLSSLIDYTSDLKDSVTLTDCYDNINNPIRSTNLIILACKHNKLHVLQYLLEGDSKVLLHNLSIGIGKFAILPEDVDEESHNAFYYAIRSGNTQLLDILIKKWSDNYFKASSEELEGVLSRAYDELKLRNVLLPEEMEGFVENELINLRFFANASGQDQGSWSDINKTRERIALVLKFVEFLKANYSKTEEVDGRFIFVAKSIVQNINILKQRLRSTYDRLPWEEMEFCLVIFVSSRIKAQEVNVFYRTILNKTKILKYVENFAKELTGDAEKDITKGDKLHCLPKGEKRDVVVAKIIGTSRQFEELYNDYQQIRDIYSLEKISDNIKLATLADPQEKEGQLVITRVLQVIGENIKNTLESPKLSHPISELLVLSLSKNTRKIIGDLRDAISHAEALSARIQIEEKADSFFFNIQNDIKKIGNVVTDILFKNKIKTIRILLTKIDNSENLNEIKEVLEEISTVDLDKWGITDNFKTMEDKKIKKLVQELSDNIVDKNDYENDLFNKINSIINNAGAESIINRCNYIVGFENLRKFIQLFGGDKTDPNIIRVIKIDAKKSLQKSILDIEHTDVFKKIRQLLRKIFDSVESREHHSKIDEVNRLSWELLHIAYFEIGGINWIEELGAVLDEDDSHSRNNVIEDRNCLNLFGSKLSDLNSVLNKNTLTGPLVNALDFYKKDKKMEAAVEMLVLDIMTILGTSENFLQNNFLFLDDNTPLLNGKCLRNHLAHHNTVVDILSDPSRAVLLNARKLITEVNIMTSEGKIGKLVREDPVKLKEKFDQSLNIITNQERMFGALQEGNKVCVQDCLLKGADVKARSVSLWTTLHFAAKGPSLEVVKFILGHNLSANVEDNDGQTPLHIAAAYGRKEIVDFFVTEAGLCVDVLTKHSMAPLHFAAKNGHKDTVEILLKNKANTYYTHDIQGLLPLHYAIKNNHFYIAKRLLQKEINDEINETKGGYTPLHEAVKYGHIELVTFFLKKGANVNATTDQNTTPLQLAALIGNLEVVNALIVNGANVNTESIHYITPLHNASYHGNLEITTMLLKHGASVNAGISTFEGITPLHFAVQNGHLEVVAILVKYGADMSAQSRKIAPPLHYTALHGQPEIAALLIEKGAEINAKSYNNLTALHVAAGEGHKKVAQILINSKAQVNSQNVQGFTPLHAAAGKGSKDIIDLLIKNEADVNFQSVDGYTPLHRAVTNGHEAAVDFLIKKNADVNTKNKQGNTPLHLAVSESHKNIVKLLIKNKAQVHEVGFGDSTPLHVAAQRSNKKIIEILVSHGAKVNDKSYVVTPLYVAIMCNHKEIVEVLLAYGANINSGDIETWSTPVIAGYKDIVEMLLKNQEYVNYKDSDHVTPLHFAAKGGHKRIAKILIGKGAHIDAVTMDNNLTPLFMAAQEGYEEVVKILLACEADVNIKSKNNVTPLHIAAIKGHSNVVKVLLLDNTVDIKIMDNNNNTPLQSAVRCEHLEVVKMLLQYKNINMDAKTDNDFTLLHIASLGSNLELVKHLVHHGFDINARNSDGLKPIHFAATAGYKETIEFFISMGLNISDVGVFNLTLLHCAAGNGHLEIVKYLIDKGADVNAQESNGSTPLHFAALFGCKDVIDILLKNGANYNAVDKYSKTPLEMNNYQDVVDLLSSTKMLFDAIDRNSLSEVQKYIKAGAFVSAKNTENKTPLHYAARNGYDKIVNILLRNNANPNLADNKGITPLHCAAEFSHFKIVKALLSNYAVYEPVSVGGKTPSDLTVDEDITNLLKLVSKAFKNITDGNSRVIDDLSKINDIDIVKSIMCARNRDNRTLVVAAIHSNFSHVQELKDISQGDVSTQINEANELYHSSHYQEALRIFKNVMEKRKKILGSDNPGTFDIQKSIVASLLKLGDYKEALEISEGIFQKEKEMLGLNNKDTLNTRSTIALTIHLHGRNEEAFNIYKEVYQKQNEILGPNDSDVLKTQFSMALVLTRQGKHEEALNINKSIYGKMEDKNHSIAWQIQNNMANILNKQGKHEEAMDICKTALENAKAVLGTNHFETLNILSNTAGVLCSQEKYHKSLKAYQDLLNIQKNVLKPNHPNTLDTQYKIGTILFLQDKWISALKVHRECLDPLKAIYGSNHENILDILKQIGKIIWVLKTQGNEPSEILKYLRKEINMVACRGDVHTLQSLLGDGANANDKDINGRTPLHHAVYNGHMDIVKMLLIYGADVTQATNKGNTPLHTAADKGHKEIAEVLLQHVSRNKLNDFIDAKTTASGATALHIAAKNAHLDVAKSLLKRGAIYDIRNNQGETPLDLSAGQNIINFLKVVEELFKGAEIGNVEIIDKLRLLKTDEFEAATHARNNQRHTLLEIVTLNSHSNLASKLLEELKIQTKL